MPAFGATLSTDEIDALAGFLVSPRGGNIFTENCSDCHDSGDLAAISPFDLQIALNEGTAYPAHADLDIPDWNEVVVGQDRTALLNFLLAPDGQRLYTLYCAECHGPSLVWEGVHTYRYVARATTPGTFVVPPAKAEEMYTPEVYEPAHPLSPTATRLL